MYQSRNFRAQSTVSQQQMHIAQSSEQGSERPGPEAAKCGFITQKTQGLANAAKTVERDQLRFARKRTMNKANEERHFLWINQYRL